MQWRWEMCETDDGRQDLLTIDGIRQEVSPEFAHAFRVLMHDRQPAGIAQNRASDAIPAPVPAPGRGKVGSAASEAPGASYEVLPPVKGSAAEALEQGRPYERVRSDAVEGPAAHEDESELIAAQSRATTAPRRKVTVSRETRPNSSGISIDTGSGVTPRQKRGKPCPKCHEIVGPRTFVCFCGHNFYPRTSS